MKQAASFLDKMPEEERQLALDRANKRLQSNKSRKGIAVSHEFYMAAEMGYYFGWDAVLALRRGFTVDPSTGEKELFTMQEAHLLIEGARKVWYSKVADHAEAGVISSKFQSTSSSFDEALRPIKDKARIE